MSTFFSFALGLGHKNKQGEWLAINPELNVDCTDLPTEIAIATPAQLPVPTRAARLVINAWKEEIPVLSLPLLVFIN